METERVVGWRIAVATAVVAAVLGAALTAAVARTEAFSDIGGTAFEEQVGVISASGCASGFPDDTFRPRDPTTRGQFAYWTVNCGARLSHNVQTTNTALATSTTTDLASTTVETAGAGGGFGYLLLQANVQAYTVVPATCPCRINVQIRDDERNVTSPSRSMTVLGHATETDVFENLSMSWIVDVPNGFSGKFIVQATLVDANASTFARSDISAVYAPFYALE